MSKERLMITLVHGTWAKDAPWTQRGSKLRKALEKQGYRVEAVSWRADNRFAARKDGAVILRDHLKYFEKYNHVVIAHSHGGNVALRATDGNDSLLHGLVCLNTPFINVLDRHAGFFPNIGMVAAFTAMFIPIGLGLRDGFSWMSLLYYLLILAVVIVVGVLFKPFRRWVLRRSQKFRKKSLQQTPIYCLNTPDDEAYGALAFFASLQNILFLAISSPALFNRQITALIGALVLFEVLPFLYLPWDLLTDNYLFTRELYDSLLGNEGSSNPQSGLLALGQMTLLYVTSSMYFYGIYALTVLSLLIIISALVTVTQGVFAPFSGLFNRFLVTLVPLQGVNTKFEEIEGDKKPLRHSSMYDDPGTHVKIIDWIEGLNKTNSIGN